MSQKLHNPKSFAPAVYIPCWLIQVPIALLSHGAKMTYGRLSQWADELGHAYRSSKQLAKELGASEKSIEKYLKQLRMVKLIGTYHPQAGGVNHFEFYDHEWMHAPINEQLTYKKDKRDIPSDCREPSLRLEGNLPSDCRNINIKEIKEIKKTKEIYNACAPAHGDSCQPQPENHHVNFDMVASIEDLQPPTGEPMIDTDYEYPDTYFPTTVPSSTHRNALEPLSEAKQMEALFSPEEPIKEQYRLSDEDFQTFVYFWDIYPRKINKIRAMHAWFGSGCHRAAPKILIKLAQQVEKDSSYLEGFSPAPVNYIQGHRWLDDIVVKKKKGTFDHDDCSWADSSRRSFLE